MTLYEFTPPHFPDLAWDQTSPLFRHFGTLEVGHTLYKKDDVWYTLDEGYEEDVLDGASVVYRGGRIYFVTVSEYVDLYLAGFIPNASIGFYPGQCPGAITFPVDDPPPPIVPGGDMLFFPGDDTYPGDDLYPEAEA